MGNYQITLRAEGPIHIGDGGKIGKKEYIFHRGKVYVPDMVELCRFLDSQGLLASYENFFLNKNELDKRKGFTSWLEENHLLDPDHPLEPDTPWIAYSMDGADLRRSKRKEILTFVKDPYGCPYIPGSSLKGMLRTILLSDMVLRDRAKLGATQNSVRQAASRMKIELLPQETENLEQRFFHTLHRPKVDPSNKVNDMMSGFRVSDSRPLCAKDLILCQKIDLTINGQERPLPILRECLRPGTQVTFDLSLADSFPFSPAQLIQAAERCQREYDQCFAQAFPLNLVQGGDGIAYLGGGAGYASKTATYPLLGINDGVATVGRILHKQQWKHKHDQDVRKGVSPHMLKCARYGGKLYEMGACSIAIKEIL